MNSNEKQKKTPYVAKAKKCTVDYKKNIKEKGQRIQRGRGFKGRR